ncbi:hypothetical protein [Streptosporangium lutulentum]|uniref:Uncharacterized protein n=1 Tax=Streptosporangium lutulentum TaxID=1461250 RepID=A0ABT9QWN6_9ACTN|nr:hypothetical protein [Streptosporangium lutulentum]MDP9850444.1 hypothetical protein [Streptosporangium lutulentum]
MQVTEPTTPYIGASMSNLIQASAATEPKRRRGRHAHCDPYQEGDGMMRTARGEHYFAVSEFGEAFGVGMVHSDDQGRRTRYEHHDPAIALRAGLEVARYSWVRAVAVISEEAAPAQVSLAVTFAAHLYDVRHARGLRGACVTSTGRPDLLSCEIPDELCCIPHLTTVQDPDGSRREVVVREVLTRERLDVWLNHTGVSKPVDLDTLERRLPYLIALRRAARQGRLPDSSAAHELRELLNKRYLSILLVMQRPDLFVTLAPLPEDRP